jgi:hypothetical protein
MRLGAKRRFWAEKRGWYRTIVAFLLSGMVGVGTSAFADDTSPPPNPDTKHQMKDCMAKAHQSTWHVRKRRVSPAAIKLPPTLRIPISKASRSLPRINCVQGWYFSAGSDPFPGRRFFTSV